MAKVGRKVKMKNKSTKPNLPDNQSRDIYRRLFYIIPVFTILVYIKALSQDYINFDDDWYIYENIFVTQLSWSNFISLFSSPHHGQYSPMHQFALSIFYNIYNNTPALLKAFSILIHIANIFLIYKVLIKLFQNSKAAFFITAIFALHPLQVESVVWITANFKLSVTFSLLAILCYLKFIDSRKIIYYLILILLFIAAFTTKEQAVLLPLSIITIDILKGRQLFSKVVILEKLPLLLMSLLFGILTIYIANTGQDVQPVHISIISKLYLASLALLRYFGNMILPVSLTFSYIFPMNLAIVGQSTKIGLTVLVIVILFLLLWSSRKSRNRLFGVLFYLANISLAIFFVFFSLRDFYMADRYLYLASLGFFIFMYFGITKIAELIKKDSLAQILFIAYIIFISILTFNRIDVFANSETLWSDAIEKNPENYMAFNNRGHYFRTQNNYDKALRDYNESIRINPNYHLSQSNRGKIYFDRQNYEKAIIDYSKSLELNSGYTEAWSNRGAAYAITGNLDQGLSDLNRALKIEPDHTNSLSNRALIWMQKQEYEKAIKDFNNYIKVKGNDPDIINSIGICYMNLKDYNNALINYDKSILIDSNKGSFYSNRAYCYYLMNNLEMAKKDVAKAKQLGVKIPQILIEMLK